MPRPTPPNDEAHLSRGWDSDDLIELKHVEQVVEVCRTGAITDAARNLSLTQPALSKSIARLEQQLGVQLFDRGGGSVRPTRYGQLLADKGPALLGSASALRQEIALLATGASGRLRMGAGPASRIKPLKALIPAIVQKFPLLKLEVREENGDSLVQAMAEGRYDIVFSYYESARPFGELMRVKVVEDRRAAVVRPGHPALDLRRALTPRDLLKFPLASAGSIPAFREWAGVMSPEELRNAGAILCEDYDIIADCARTSDAIAWGPRFAFEGPLGRGELVEIAITWPAKYACWMLTTEAHWKLPVVKAIAELAKSLAPREAAPVAIAGA
ncbi:MAG: LysR family transcriptional regulator [Phenylobacterium sp.]|nr:LysR family transcriptional regulator [Phenylobacterium sp.]MCW5759682.1 LysR family transcriptional regulator [Phenylobacterium sp.]